MDNISLFNTGTKVLECIGELSEWLHKEGKTIDGDDYDNQRYYQLVEDAHDHLQSAYEKLNKGEV